MGLENCLILKVDDCSIHHDGSCIKKYRGCPLVEANWVNTKRDLFFSVGTGVGVREQRRKGV